MEIFDIILLIAVLLTALRFISGPDRFKPTADRWLLAALAALLIASPFVGQLRWQTVPLLVLAGISVVLLLVNLFSGRLARGRWLGWVLLPLALLSMLLPIAVPILKLPTPTGLYSVGSTRFYWVDSARIDPYDGQLRRLNVQVWYPVEGGNTARLPRAPYLENLDIAGPAIVKIFNLPAFTLSHLKWAKTSSFVNAPVAGSRPQFPVLLFSHGWKGYSAQTTFQMEELASQGYIVFSADHTYGASITVFPDGTAVPIRSSALPSGVTDEVYDRAARILGQTWVGDLKFVLDQAEKLQSNQIVSPLAGKLDLARVGALGHSTGGGAVIEFCYVDARCKAGLSMDAWLIPYDRQIPVNGLKQPFLFMQSEVWTAYRNPELTAALYGHMQPQAFRMKILGTNHYDFTDLPLMSPAASLIGLKGPIPSDQLIKIVNTYSVSFFDQALKGNAAIDLSKWSGQFPQVKLERNR